MIEPTPYMRGVADACAGKPGPAFPKPDSSWGDRLYARGWSDAMDERLKHTPHPSLAERKDRMSKADELSKRIKDLVNKLLFDKRIARATLIEAFEDASADLDGVIDSLKDDERRKPE